MAAGSSPLLATAMIPLLTDHPGNVKLPERENLWRANHV